MKEKEEKRIILQASIIEGGKAVLRLTDTGTGISPEDLNHLFQPFFTTKPEGRGNGLRRNPGVLIEEIRAFTFRNLCVNISIIQE
jgi:nitrogen-specific signal transduction histidine kinase